jgi:hypothetical protein
MHTAARFGLVLVLIVGMSPDSWTQSNSALLEKGIYAEETLGNLKDAINAYLQIIGNADAARPVAAQALFRLGICYQKIGKQADAQSAFSKLAQLYPEQKELIARIPASPAVTALQFLPAPWQDEEVLELVENTKGTGASGLHVFRVESAEENGQKAWRFEWIRAYGKGNVLSTNVLADANSLVPLSADIRGLGIDAHAKFLVGHVKIQPSKKGTPGDIPLKSMVYDDSQAFQFIRCLPLVENPQITIPLIDILSGAVTDARVLVEGREKITVPAGTFDCYRVLISRGPRGVANEQTVWITADSHAYIAKASFSEDTEIELASVHSAPKDVEYEMEYRQLGFRLLIPAGWQIYRIPHDDHPKDYDIFEIIPPELKAECSLEIYTDSRGPASSGAASHLKSVLQRRGWELTGYAIRGENPETIDISGIPAGRAIADFRDAGSGKEMVEYYVLLFTGTRMVELQMRVEKKSFEEMRPIFDSIAYSLRFF